MAKRGRKQIGETKVTSAEGMAKSRDKAASIDGKLREARDKINWRRRKNAEKSLANWIKTYCIGIFIDDPPPPHGIEILNEMEAAVGDSRPYQILMSRGHGKTSYTEACVAYALATARRKFCVVVSLNKDAASQIVEDVCKLFEEEPFSVDYPDISLPIILKDGAWKRRQRSGGKDTEVKRTVRGFVFPCVVDNDGEPVPTSGSCIVPKALKSVRGTKRRTLRPDLVVLDDLQTTSDADSEEQVEKKLRMIRSDVMNVGGKQKISIINTATVIAPDDLAERIAKDKAWKTTRFRGMINFPEDWRRDKDCGLWAEYFRKFDGENSRDLPHADSLAFYKEHRDEMDEGAEVLNPMRYDKDKGQVSGIQHLMDKMHEIGWSAFAAEYQMTPLRRQYAFELTAQHILERVRFGLAPHVIPAGFVFTCAATDINPSYALTTVIAAFAPDRTCVILDHLIQRIHIDDTVNDTVFAQKIYEVLAAHGRMLASFGIKIDAWGIDAAGKQWEAVNTFAANSRIACGLPCCSLRGWSKSIFNPRPRSHVRDAINNTVHCADHAKGWNWINWETDTYKESAQRAFLTVTGAPGGCSLFDGDINHDEFAIQVANETIASISPDGRKYEWKSKDPHDYLDCLGMCYAIAGHFGISGTGSSVVSSTPSVSVPTSSQQQQKTRPARKWVTSF